MLAVHSLDMAWRAGLTVGVAVLLTRRAERIRELADSRRSLAAQALAAESRARRELSYVLHDELVQELLCAGQDLKAARRGRTDYIDRAELAVAGAVRRLREEIFQLHPHVLERAGLEAALEAVAARQLTAEGVRAEVLVDPEAMGPDDELLFSIGRELLTNAIRHSEAAEIELTVEREGDRIVLCCHDDGRGMTAGRRAEALAGGHLGLAACTERVEALGGTLEVASAPGEGTLVRVAIQSAVAAPEPSPVAGAAPAAVADAHAVLS
jgi:two-component system, NarL family, sensor kinase